MAAERVKCYLMIRVITTVDEGKGMQKIDQKLGLHHVSLPVRDLEISKRFYEVVIGLDLIPRPGFGFTGAWFGLGAGQLHLIVNPSGTYPKTGEIGTQDAHFALYAADFSTFVAHLKGMGYGADLPEGDPKRVIVKPASATGFAQVFLNDPDGHTVEVNAATVCP